MSAARPAARIPRPDVGAGVQDARVASGTPRPDRGAGARISRIGSGIAVLTRRPDTGGWWLAPTAAGLAYAGLACLCLAGATVQQTNVLVFAFALMAVPPLLAVRLAGRVLHGLRVRTAVAQPVYAGQATALDWFVDAGRRREAAVALRLTERFDYAGPVAAAGTRVRERVWASATVALLPAGETAFRKAPLTLPRRGRWRRRSRVATVFPFGLLRRRRRLTPGADVVVYPSLGRLDQRWLAAAGVGVHRQRPGAALSVVQTGEIRYVREYRPGDSPRHVHWPSTARRGELMVKQFDPPDTVETLLLVELRQPGNAGAEQLRHVETALAFAATFCARYLQNDDVRLTLAVADARPEVLRGSHSARFLDECCRRLALAEGAADARAEACIGLLPTGVAARSRTWLVTTRDVPRIPTALRGGRRTTAVRPLSVPRGDLAAIFRTKSDADRA